MKKSLILVSMLFLAQVASAFTPAPTPAAEDGALFVLMNDNPEYYDENLGANFPINSLISMNMLSSIPDEDGNLYLTQIYNDCELVPSTTTAVTDSYTYACTLMFLNSDRVIDADGSIEPAAGMTESSVVIEYLFSFDAATGKQSVSDLKVSFAG